MGIAALQTSIWSDPPGVSWRARWRARIDERVDAQGDRLFCWLPVATGLGTTAWLLLPGPSGWMAVMLCGTGLALIGFAFGAGTRLAPRILVLAGLAAALGCGLIWLRSERVAQPVLARPVVAVVTGTIETAEWLAARGTARLVVRLDPGQNLPVRARISVPRRPGEDADRRLAAGARIHLRARLMPPPGPALPGGYDFQRRAWFDGIGAVGSALGPVTVDRPASGGDSMGVRLSRHIRSRVAGSTGGIAAAFATGERGGIAEVDEEAMRRSGLAHLLSISGLHVSAAVAGVMWLTMRLLALSPWLALRLRLHLVAGALGAAFGLGYTLLTGAEVPTVRSLIAALLVLLALALGRQALSMRLVAIGALAVMIVRPEAIAGPSFQLSFAAIAAIVALHGHPRVAALLAARDESWLRRQLRGLLALAFTGLAVEIALLPIALFHFHKAGIYGSLANLVAIPLTTFVVMPAEALALLLDLVGLGAPMWWIVERALSGLLWLAHTVASMPGSVVLLPSMPRAAFALCMGGGLWLWLIAGRARWWGCAPWLMGMIWAALVPAPDLLVTGDGHHVAIRADDGRYYLLRERAGDYVRDQIAEASGSDDDALAVDAMPGARCSPDFCLWSIRRGGRPWTVLASRSSYRVDWVPLVAACAQADVVVSDRRLPRGCTPRWIKADREALERSGGLAIRFSPPVVNSVAADRRGKPWADPPRIAPTRIRFPSGINDSGATAPRDVPAP